MAYMQADIPIQNAETFERLKGLVNILLDATHVDGFMKAVAGQGLKVREVEKMLDRAVFDKASGAKAGIAASLYRQLPASDQGQFREFYLTCIEEVGSEVRRKHQKVYRYE